jgi:hypothetical protein
VISPDGKPAKPSQEAQRLRSLAPNGSQVLVTLPPQQSISYEWDLSDDFDFAQRGTYRATVARKVETINEIDTSNTIEIKQP